MYNGLTCRRGISWVILALTGLLTVQGTPPEADPGPQPNPLTQLSGFPQGIPLPDGITPDNFAKFLAESGRALPTNLPGDDVCGNQDFLTNLLVYQYLSGSVPGNGNTPTPVVPAAPVFIPTTTTTTSLSTSLTTLVRTLEASTQFSTSTTSYVTTITSVETTVLPVIFRGSKVTTTLTNSKTEVITATEFFTTSSVVTPSIVQTLPVEITLSITRTKGFNGEFTVADLSRGASTVLDQPITTATVDLNAASGLDISNLDLAGIDLTSLSSLINSQGSSSNDQADMLAQLAALLNGEDALTASGPRDEDYFDTGFRLQGPPSQRNNFNNNRSKFHTNSSPNPRNPFSQHPQAPRSQAQHADEPPFKVLPGFTLRDNRPAPPRNTQSGSATQNTRFSKYHKRPSSSDNGQKDRDPPADRERQRFSGSERRPTFSRAGGTRAKSTRSSRKVPDEPAFGVNFFEDEDKFSRFSPRQEPKNVNHKPHPEVQSSRLRSGILRPRQPSPNSPIVPARPNSQRLVAPKRPASPKPNVNIPQLTPGKTTKIFTMFLSGSNGETITTLRTVTLRNLQTRYRREATGVNDATEIIDATRTYQMPVETKKPSLSKTPTPKEVITMLKKLDQKNVKEMLKSLQKWVSYYSK
ncbi:unnamed protein product, partial [Meganyctiphanes norvegica]